MRILDLPLVTKLKISTVLQSEHNSSNYHKSDVLYSKAQEFFWLELKIKDPGNLKQKTKQHFPVILPHELFDYMQAPRLIQNTRFSRGFKDI